MFKIEKKQESYLNYKLIDTQSNTTCTITPEKGGMCTSFTIDDEEMIYLNEENYYSDLRTRCAVPILFPTTGLCEQDTLCIDGKKYPMGIHGIAHAQSWVVIDMKSDTCAQLTIRLQSNETTLKSYPFHFTYDVCYQLQHKTLTMKITIQNHEPKEMPFSLGFHPYFKVSNVNNLKFKINAEKIQNDQGNFEPCEHISFPYAPETKVTLANVASPCEFMDEATGHHVRLDFDQTFSYVILWSLCEQNFICMEPWTNLPNELNEGKGQIIAPQGVYTTEINITFDS